VIIALTFKYFADISFHILRYTTYRVPIHY